MNKKNRYEAEYKEISDLIIKLMNNSEITVNERYQLGIALGGIVIYCASRDNVELGLKIIDIVRDEFLNTMERKNSFSEN
jgi:hypothetical protein